MEGRAKIMQTNLSHVTTMPAIDTRIASSPDASIVDTPSKASSSPQPLPGIRCPVDALGDSWSLWYHKLDDPSWDIQSYRKITTFSTVTDFWRVLNSAQPISTGYYFIMKAGILPIYEDPANEKGCIWSFRIKRAKLEDIWLRVAVHMIGNTLYSVRDEVNGISVNPNNTVIKVWLKSSIPEAQRRCNVAQCSPFIDPKKARYSEQKDQLCEELRNKLIELRIKAGQSTT